MPIQEKQLVGIALINAYLIFFWLIICKYGGLALPNTTTTFLDFYTFFILMLILSPVLILNLKWILKKEHKPKHNLLFFSILIFIAFFFYFQQIFL